MNALVYEEIQLTISCDWGLFNTGKLFIKTNANKRKKRKTTHKRNLVLILLNYHYLSNI